MKLSLGTVNLWAAAVGALFNGGTIDFYDGAPPHDVDDALGDQTHLARFRFGTPACANPVAGVVESHDLTAELTCMTDEPRWFRVASADGTAVMDGTAGFADDDVMQFRARGVSLDSCGLAFVVDSFE
jgi:hypothetical protein